MKKTDGWYFKMRVKIGPYTSWIGPYQIVDGIFFWQDPYPDKELRKRWDYKLSDKLSKWLAATWVNDFCQFIYDNFQKRVVKIKIDRYDSWSADHTLALIILPVLKQLRDTKHGSPWVDDEDVPDHLKSTDAPPKENEYDTDDNHHLRWEWVLDEMIWSFEQHNDDKAEDQFHTGDHDILWKKVNKEGVVLDEKLYKLGDDKKGCDDTEDGDDILWEMVEGPNNTHKFDKEGWEAWHARKQNGFKLFGKYYQNLWD